MPESEFNENDYAPPNTINNNDTIGLPLNESFINFENNENNNDNDDETTDHSNIRLDRIQNIITLIPNKKISISKKCKIYSINSSYFNIDYNNHFWGFRGWRKN